MGESAVADFTARVRTADSDSVREGRVVLSRKRLVLAAGGSRTTIPLENVYAVTVNEIEENLRTHLEDTVVVEYRSGSRRLRAAIEGDPDPIDRFQRVLFKTLLHGRSVLLENPATVGGRVVRPAPQRATLGTEPGRLEFDDCRSPFSVDLGAVVDVRERPRTLDGTEQTALSVTHRYGDAIVTTNVAGLDDRVRNILRCYLGTEYRHVLDDLADLEQSEPLVRTLVWSYATGETPPEEVVPEVDSVLETLGTHDLIGDDGSLTTHGLAATRSFRDSIDV